MGLSTSRGPTRKSDGRQALEEPYDPFRPIWSAVIRPPRCLYSLDSLGPKRFRLAGTENRSTSSPHDLAADQEFERRDVFLRNGRGQRLCCSCFAAIKPQRRQRPCVIYLHGNAGSRLDALKVLVPLLQRGLMLFCLDFAGCGLSDGHYVSLGHFEEDDIKTAIDFLRSSGMADKVGLWAKSMGAVAAISQIAKDDRVGAAVLDSPFADFGQLVDEQIARSSFRWAPSFVLDHCRTAVFEEVERRAGFEALGLQPVRQAPSCKIPALLMSGCEDVLVPPEHVAAIHDAWGGPSQLVSIPGGSHNSERPATFVKQAAEFLSVCLDASTPPQTEVPLSLAMPSLSPPPSGAEPLGEPPQAEATVALPPSCNPAPPQLPDGCLKRSIDAAEVLKVASPQKRGRPPPTIQALDDTAPLKAAAVPPTVAGSKLYPTPITKSLQAALPSRAIVAPSRSIVTTLTPCRPLTQPFQAAGTLAPASVPTRVLVTMPPPPRVIRASPALQGFVHTPWTAPRGQRQWASNSVLATATASQRGGPQRHFVAVAPSPPTHLLDSPDDAPEATGGSCWDWLWSWCS